MKNAVKHMVVLSHNMLHGKKDEVLRHWELYKKNKKVYNRGYRCVISYLLKFDDIKSAEKVLVEWESPCEHYDIRIFYLLIFAYCRKLELL